MAILLPDARLGGAQSVLLRLAEEFVALGLQVDVVLLVADGALIDRVPASTRCIPLLDGDRGGLSMAGLGFVRLWKYLIGQRPECVLSSGTGTNLLLIACSAFVRLRPRLVLREAVSNRNSPSWIMRQLVRFCFRRADACIGVSQGVAGELRRSGIRDDRIHAVPNPVDYEVLQRLARQECSVDLPEMPYVISVGRLERQKDHETLIRAFGRIAKRVPHRLIIVGEGPCRPRLERLVADLGLQERVLLLGTMINPQPLVQRADLFVLSSSWEGYPNALLEALAHGVRVVCTDCPHGPAEILQSGRYGALVPVGDDAAMADAMIGALSKPSLAAGWLEAQPRPQEIARRYLGVMRVGGDRLRRADLSGP